MIMNHDPSIDTPGLIYCAAVYAAGPNTHRTTGLLG